MQEAVVTAIVAWAVCLVTWRYLPPPLKRPLRAALSRLSGEPGLMRRRLRDARGSAGCGTCSGCGGMARPDELGTQTIALDALRKSVKQAR